MAAKRALLMYISEISGHHSATNAIEKALKTLMPDIVIRNINGFNYTNPILEKIINRAYLGLIKKTPEVWEYLYDNPNIVRSTRYIKQAIHRLNHRKLKILLDEFSPDFVVCSQAFPCGMVADYKKTYNLQIPLMGVLTDYAPHAYWLYDEIDYFIVASQEARERLIQEGIRQERIKILGIPIDHKFSKVIDNKKIAEDLGLDLSVPIILIMGGGQGIGPVKKIIKSFNRIKPNFQIIVVCGTNQPLLRWLNKYRLPGKKIVPLGYVNNVDEIMSVSTLLITKPGGITSAEALAKGLPMIIVHPIPGQEANNTQYLLKRGAAVKVDTVGQLDMKINEILNNQEVLNKLRQCAREASFPDSSIEIAKLILQNNV